jgi:hypothetical protein
MLRVVVFWLITFFSIYVCDVELLVQGGCTEVVLELPRDVILGTITIRSTENLRTYIVCTPYFQAVD